MNCKYKYVAPVTGLGETESILHNKLKKAFPNAVINGDSKHYTMVMEDPGFKKFFGDWTNPDKYNDLVESARNTRVFNEQGEPELLSDSSGEYFLSLTGEQLYLRDIFTLLTSEELSDVTNTIVGEYINIDNISIKDFTKNVIQDRIDDLTIEIAEKQAVVDSEEDIVKQDELAANLVPLENLENKLKSLIEDSSMLDLLAKRVENKLNKFNFKYTETVSDKEDDMTSHEDIVNYILESNETSNRAVNDTEILKFLSTIPKFKDDSYSEDVNNQEKQLSPTLNTTAYMEQNEVWGMMEGLLKDIIPDQITKDSFSKDLFDNYKNKIEATVKITKHPELNFILDKLNNADETFKTKLVNAFYKSSQNYLITQITKDGDKRIFKIVDPSIQGDKKGKLLNEYVETIINNKSINLNAIRKEIQKDLKILEATNNKEIYKNTLDKYIKRLGINVNPRALNYYVSEASPSEMYKALYSFTTSKVKDQVIKNHLGDDVEGDITVIDKLKTLKKTDVVSDLKDYLLRKDTILKQLSKADAIFKSEVAESTVIVGGKQRWNISYTTTLDRFIQEWKNGNTEQLEKLKDKGYYIVDFLLNNPERIQDIKLNINSELKGENDSNPVLHKRITEVDLHWDIFAKMFNSKDSFYDETINRRQGVGAQEDIRKAELSNYITYNFGADKNSLYSIFGLPRPTEGKSEIYNIETGKIKSDLKAILSNYVKGEFKRAYDAGLVVEGYYDAENKRDYLMKNLVPGYHYKTNKDIETEELNVDDFNEGSYNKIGIFTSSLQKYLKEHKKLVYDTANTPVVRIKDFVEGKNFNDLMSIVYADFESNLQKNIDYLKKIVVQNGVDENGDALPVQTLFDLETNIQFDSVDRKISDYVISSFMANYELSNIMNGHISFYKQSNNTDQELTDFLKRAPAVVTDGLYPRHRNTGESKTYTDYEGNIQTIADRDDSTVVAVVNELDIDKSKFADIINAAKGGKKEKYAHEIADAQGYMTAEHFRDTIERIYGWNEYDTKNFNELTDPNHNFTDENLKWIKKFSKSYTPLKMVHFELKDDVTPIYLKYSLAPLFPSMIAGTEMQRLYDGMKNQGVEQVVFKSGSKASNYAPTTLHNLNEDGSYGGFKNGMKFNPFTIDTSLSKMQVQMPTKTDNSITLGNQAIKNIMSNMDVDSDVKAYEYNGMMHTAKEMHDMINESAVSILQTQLNSVLNRLGYNSAEDTFSTKDIKKLLLNQMDIETEADLIEFLKSDLPLETIPNFAQRAFPVISKFLHKNAGKIYTNGGSVVQVANVGYDKLNNKSKKGIFFFDESNTELTPPLPVTDKKGNILYYDELGKVTTKDKGRARIKKAKILLPFTSIFAKSGLSYNEFINLYKKGKISKDIFNNSIGYRIPNQAVSSNDSFEIVGILPPIAGDQAVVYHEITAKTGSDFDIDKMYTMLPNFYVDKKYYLPEENKVKLGKDVPHIWDLTNERNFGSGNEVLQFLSKDDMLFNKMFDLAGKPKLKNKRLYMEHPLTFILNNYNELHSLAEDNSLSIVDETGTTIEYKTILADIKQAYDKQKVLLKEKNNEAWKKYKQLEEIRGINYIFNDTYQGQQNKLIELLGSILEAETSYDDLMSPLDNKEMIKGAINKVKFMKANPDIENPTKEQINEFINETKSTGFEQMFPVNLVKSRVDVLEAKTLISIMANNMTDISESQKVSFGLKYSIGLKGSTDATSLANVFMLNEEGNPEQKITKIVSYLMNASVDAAKDNYIIEGNFTGYTANAAMLMTRLGIDMESLFSILMNDTILDFSRKKTFSTAKLSDYKFDLDADELNRYSKIFLKKLAENDNDLFKVISKQDFIENDPSKHQDIMGFWNLVQTVGKEFNDSVVTTKSDSNGAGANIPEFMSLLNRIEKVKKNTIYNSFEKWFTDGLTEENETFNPNIQNNPNVKYLGAMANNTLFLMDKLSKDLFLETSTNVREIVNTALGALGVPNDNAVDNIKLIYNYLYPSILYSSGHKIYNIDSNREKYLLKEFPKKLQAVKNALKDNLFLNELIINTRENKNLINFPNYKNYDSYDKLRFKESVLDLMKLNIGLVDELVQYAFITTGFKSTYYSFNDIIPASYFINNMHGRNIANLKDQLNTRDVIDFSKAFTLMAKTNYNNFKIVKNLSKRMKVVPNIPVTDEDTLERITIEENVYYPFVKKQGNLYMLTNKENNLPIYSFITKIDQKKFKTYSFNGIEDGLYLEDTTYKSQVEELYEGFQQNEEDLLTCPI